MTYVLRRTVVDIVDRVSTSFLTRLAMAASIQIGTQTRFRRVTLAGAPVADVVVIGTASSGTSARLA